MLPEILAIIPRIRRRRRLHNAVVVEDVEKKGTRKSKFEDGAQAQRQIIKIALEEEKANQDCTRI